MLLGKHFLVKITLVIGYFPTIDQDPGDTLLKMVTDCYKHSKILCNSKMLPKNSHARVAVMKVKKEKQVSTCSS